MNKRAFGILFSLFTAGLSMPFALASKNTSGAELEIEVKNETEVTNEEALSIKENPFPGLKRGYFFKSLNAYNDAIWRKIQEIDSKSRDIHLIKSLNDKEKEFKGFCDEILNEKSEDYSKYSEQWKNYIDSNKTELEDYRDKLNGIIDSVKDLILLVESGICFTKNCPVDVYAMFFTHPDRFVKFLMNQLKVFLSNKNYCNAWLNYADENSDLSKFDKKTINSITNYPNYNGISRDSEEKVSCWYEDLFDTSFRN